jgi:hypothetical protein
MPLLSRSSGALLCACVLPAMFVFAASACHHDPPAEGPAQRAGEKVDNAARDTKDAVKDSAHDVKHDMQK